MYQERLGYIYPSSQQKGSQVKGWEYCTWIKLSYKVNEYPHAKAASLVQPDTCLTTVKTSPPVSIHLIHNHLICCQWIIGRCGLRRSNSWTTRSDLTHTRGRPFERSLDLSLLLQRLSSNLSVSTLVFKRLLGCAAPNAPKTTWALLGHCITLEF